MRAVEIVRNELVRLNCDQRITIEARREITNAAKQALRRRENPCIVVTQKLQSILSGKVR